MTTISRLRLARAVLAGVQVLTAGSALADVLGIRTSALIVLVVGAVQVGIATYEMPAPDQPVKGQP